MRSMHLTPPFGYGEIIPLQRSHRVLLPYGATPNFCRTLNAITVSCGEMVAAGREYPVAFASAHPGSSFAPIAVLGIAAENLFVSASGDWEAQAYVPAYVRRYPFCISKLYVDGVARGDKVVCVANAYVDDEGIAIFEADGSPTAYWTGMQQLLAELEADLDRSAAMCAAFAALDLFAPFAFTVVNERRIPGIKLEGMYRLDEKKLSALTASALQTLHARGFLGMAYAHLHSLQNFDRLYQRALARASVRPEG